MNTKYSVSVLVFVLIFSSCSDDESVIDLNLIVEDFSTTLIERPSDNLILGKINVRSNLDNINYEIINQSQEGALRIDSNTGEISVNDGSIFDINSFESINAEVEVSSKDLIKLANVVINLSLPEETISYFKDIALGFEFGNSSEITRKWTSNMKIFVGGSPSSTLSSELNSVISDINDLTSQSFSIEIVDDTLASNYYIYFGSGNSYAQIFPSVSSLVSSNWGLFSIFWNGSNELFRGHMYVDIDRANELEQRHLLREELTQSLGLARDSPKFSGSIFQQSFSTKTTEFAKIDEDLIHLLYHPDMSIGLTSTQVDSKLRQILKAEW